MRQISSEPKFASFSPALQKKRNLSCSETILEEEIRHGMCTDPLCKVRRQTMVEVVGDYELDSSVPAPDGGYGWVVCFACFMGKQVC